MPYPSGCCTPIVISSCKENRTYTNGIFSRRHNCVIELEKMRQHLDPFFGVSFLHKINWSKYFRCFDVNENVRDGYWVERTINGIEHHSEEFEKIVAQ